ncbi:MAG: hypothetical protein R6X25_05830 [Candidatus Krumholzibacteriia bacterium]
MTKIALQGSRGLLIGYAFVVLMVVFLAMRAQQTMGAVLHTDEPAVAQAQPTAAVRVADELRRRFEQLSEALPAARDPFRNPPVSVPTPRVRRAPVAAAPAAPVFPAVQAIIYNLHDSRVQVRLGDAVSDWLYEGDTFGGWKVERITADSIRVSRGDEHQQLRVQRVH